MAIGWLAGWMARDFLISQSRCKLYSNLNLIFEIASPSTFLLQLNLDSTRDSHDTFRFCANQTFSPNPISPKHHIRSANPAAITPPRESSLSHIERVTLNQGNQTDKLENMAHQPFNTQNASQSPLLLLPAELRNRIYGYVVTGSDKIDIAAEQQPGLARACTETRSECLQMYYASNLFAFAPVTEGQGSLEQLEKWLSRIGPKNCESLRKLLVTLNKDSGVLIDELGMASDTWTALYTHMHTTGCTLQLHLTAELNEDLRPDKRAFEELIRLAGSEKAAADFIAKARRLTKLALCGYLCLLKRECFDRTALQEWVSTACPVDDLTNRARDLVFYFASGMCYSPKKIVAAPPGFPVRQISQALHTVAALPTR